MSICRLLILVFVVALLAGCGDDRGANAIITKFLPHVDQRDAGNASTQLRDADANSVTGTNATLYQREAV